MERVSKLRFAFYQKTYRLPDRKPVLAAKIIGTAVNSQGRPCMLDELDRILNQIVSTSA